MIKILKNTTLAAITIKDMGIVIPASSSYTITIQEYLLWASSNDVLTYINSGNLVVNNGIEDLSIARGIKHITDVLATSVYFADNTNNGFTHNDELSVNRFTHSAYSPRLTKTITTNNTTINLTVTSNYEQACYGFAANFKYKLPLANTCRIGHEYKIVNRSSLPVSIVYDDLTTLYQIASAGYAIVTLEDNSSQDGTWIVIASNLADIDLSNPDFTGVKDGFEDFMFDAYAGNGGNDNQYAFTAIPNLGISDIDGAVSVVGNDYEGIHVLNSSIVSNSRPLVSAFNQVNRIKLGAQPESYEIRVRIETLADINQKFTTRYGLMDSDTIGHPPNGVLFSYDPIYPVTPIKQVVTVTPIVTSKAPTQIFTETINGIDYTHTYLTYQIITVTPNSFPTATYQQISITWTRLNNTTYTVIINGVTCSYTSDATATDAEISAGLSSAINNMVGAAVTATNAKPVVVTSDILGQAFTYSGTNVTITLVTANIPKAIYTQTIGGVDYVFTSDGTPTATEVVTGLKALINADSGCPATATGTTTLILTDKSDPGDTFTYSGSANLTQADTTASTTATAVVTALKTLMSSDVSIDVSGTTTLIITAKVAGIAFTYSGTANLTQFLTIPNTPEVLYSGNWICTIVNNSTATSVNSQIPIVAGRWYRLKVVIKADGSGAYFYIDSLFIDELVTQVPLVALRYVFKLEKTVGISSRTTSIDYITWRRTRG